MQKFSEKYIKQACITFLTLSSTVLMVHAQTTKQAIKNTPSVIEKLTANSDSSIKKMGIIVIGTKMELQNTLSKNTTFGSINKSIDNVGRNFLNTLSIKPSSIQLYIKEASTELLLLPKEISSSMLSQTKMVGSIEAGGITNQVYFSQQYNFFNSRGFTDFSFKSDIAGKYKKMAETLGNGYASVLNRTMQRELTQLKGLKDKIDQSLTKNIDSVVHQITDLKDIIPASFLTEFNYENIIANNNNVGIEKLKAEVIKNHGNDSLVNSKIKQVEKLLGSIEKNKQMYSSLNPDSTIARYEEVMKIEKEKLLNKPSELKKFIKTKKLQGFNFNFLMWAKSIDLGSFFSAGNLASAIKGSSAGMDIGNITKGVQVVLNNKNKMKFFLGENVTSRVDDLWQPNSMETYLNKYQASAPQLLQRLNIGLSIEDIKALGGIDLNVSQQTSTPNLNNSFFGLTRKFSNMSISKKILNNKIHQLTVDILSNITSFSKSPLSQTKLFLVPEIADAQKSTSFNVSYTGMFKKIEMETSMLFNGSFGNVPSNLGNYDRPLWDIELFVNKRFLSNKLSLTANLNSSKYSMGLNDNSLSFTNGLLNVRYSINKKNTLDVSFRGSKNGSNILINNNNHSFEMAHNASFKKNGLRYSFFTKLTALHQSTSFKSTKTVGWIRQFNSVASVGFPQNFSIQNVVSVSENTFMNNTFLTGSRFTLVPSVEFQRKKYSFSTGIVYEQVSGYYIQAGTKSSISIASFLDKNLAASASIDIRYNMKQQVPVFGSNVVSYGNLSIQYLIK